MPNPNESRITGIWDKLSEWILKLWWIFPCLFFMQTGVVYKMMYKYPCGWQENVAWGILFLIIFFDITKLVLLVKNCKWGKAIFSFCIGCVMLLILVCMSFVTMSAPTGYAKRHPIPKGIKCEIPLSYKWEGKEVPVKAKVDSLDTNSYLQIWRTQGGIYKYDFYNPSLPGGTIFLKCFEVGKNEILSSENVKKKSLVQHPSTTSFSKIVEQQEFMIYEGDWDDFYAVRVEVWHKEKASKKETKLLEKIYRMDGWSR